MKRRIGKSITLLLLLAMLLSLCVFSPAALATGEDPETSEAPEETTAPEETEKPE